MNNTDLIALNTTNPDGFSKKRFLQDCIEILIESLETYQKYPVSNLVLNDEQKVLKREKFLENFINDMFTSMADSLKSPIIARKLQESNPNHVYTLQDLISFLGKEFVMTSRAVKLNKGRSSNIEMTYKTVCRSDIQKGVNEESFEYSEVDDSMGVEERKPFVFFIKGDMVYELYQGTVKQISHPLGFSFDFSKNVLIPNINDMISDLDDNVEFDLESFIFWKEDVNFENMFTDSILFPETKTDKVEPETLESFFEDDFSIISHDDEQNPDLQLVEPFSMKHIVDDSDISSSN